MRFLCSFTFCIMLMVRKGTRNIAKNTKVRITIDTSIVVKVNLLVIKGLFDRASLFVPTCRD